MSLMNSAFARQQPASRVALVSETQARALEAIKGGAPIAAVNAQLSQLGEFMLPAATANFAAEFARANSKVVRPT